MLVKFFEQFKESNEAALHSLWTMKSTRNDAHELWLIGNACSLVESKELEYDLVMISPDRKIINHARYLIQSFWHFWEEEREEDLTIRLSGIGYQAIVSLKPHCDIEELYANGTVETVDRFGNSREREISNLTGVVFHRSRK